MTTGTRSPAPTQWSNCSLADLDEGLEMMDLGRCLTNDPILTVTDPQCGNGIREDNEICDCGTIDVSMQFLLVSLCLSQSHIHCRSAKILAVMQPHAS